MVYILCTHAFPESRTLESQAECAEDVCRNAAVLVMEAVQQASQFVAVGLFIARLRPTEVLIVDARANECRVDACPVRP